jgi:hypothetical protein
VSINSTGLPRASASALILVVSPPRDRPIACSPFFSRASAMLVSPNDSCVDHHVFVIVIARQQLENSLENSPLRPSTKALVHRFPVTETLG